MDSSSDALSSSGDQSLEQAVQQLSDKDREDLTQFLGNEQQRAKVQSTIHVLTGMCFDKCVTGKISSNQLDRNEDPCLRNCLNRFLDANLSILKHLERLRKTESI
ncbi:MAG: Mitochondrial import inner membrane translocase subunit tim8 [Lichina confinis]|nr:MAG: Mitochondrial import inner membrane translocase subunit tim8 [Lichina confinis]